MQHVWWTGPGEGEGVEIHIKPDEVVIWQHQHGNINSVNMTPEIAMEMANYIKAML